MMRLGIVGLPNVGKSTLFNAITKAGAQVANYAFCTIDPNVGVVAVPDPRLDFLTELHQPAKVTPATIEFVDIAGLVRGASRGEGLGNQFLANIRETDAIVHVIRCFHDEDIMHVDGEPDAVRDATTVNLELILADLEYLERRMEKTRKAAKSGQAALRKEIELLEALNKHLESEQPARTYAALDETLEVCRDLYLLSAKPVLYVANIAEDEIGTLPQEALRLKDLAERENAGLVVISAKIEEELQSLEPEEAAVFLEDLGLTQSGLDQIVTAGYHLLGLISFLTAGPKEVRAWTISQGTKAPQAAGVIHSDFERGFIRAEVVAFADLFRYGTMQRVKEHGLLRSEGKDYVMCDGDVTLFRFNV